MKNSSSVKQMLRTSRTWENAIKSNILSRRTVDSLNKFPNYYMNQLCKRNMDQIEKVSHGQLFGILRDIVINDEFETKDDERMATLSAMRWNVVGLQSYCDLFGVRIPKEGKEINKERYFRLKQGEEYLTRSFFFEKIGFPFTFNVD